MELDIFALPGGGPGSSKRDSETLEDQTRMHDQIFYIYYYKYDFNSNSRDLH